LSRLDPLRDEQEAIRRCRRGFGGESGEAVSDRTTIPCPACREAGSDKSGNHLAIFPSGKFHCIAAGKDRVHNRRIIELMPELGKAEHPLTSAPALAIRPRPAPKPVDLLSRIKADFPACVADLWEASPIRCDENLDDAKAFLRLFPADALLWIAADVRKTGRPEHTLFFRTRAEWEAETFTAGTRIAPSSFQRGTISRKAANVIRHLFAVVESDTLAKDDFCSVMRWLREACRWHLAAVVDSGNRSLHAWFRHPGTADIEQLEEHAAALGLDAKFSEPSQPWRLPGVARENATTRQCLLYLDAEAAL
jgi:hypothetical protein